ncbi:hypothetical protein FEM48_Zijuj06G0045800 [Ziziphus jujuba var. spinosa]|uniref:BZIP domain-containing protein n=1 Tax=Ziziphus jujuba var. spinosa TaxID=714518 RepID=A0A978V771_ZIZJJ|nr:hypothetical protein FEM48_Zijuj06G0045800 [Ziziphus jujuba var. spinosa]
MFFSDEDVHFECPVFETGFTATELEELLSTFQPGNSGSPNSGSEETSHRAIYTVEERKYRRKESNRESARRSRWRKKRHLENLTNQVNRLRLENRDLKNRLGLVAHHCHIAWRENDRLRSESFALCSRLSDLCRILQTMQ